MDWNNPLIYIVPGLAVLGWIIRLERWMGKKDESIRLIEENIVKLEAAIREIRTDIKELFRNGPGAVTAQNSPLRLTERGEAISEVLGAKAWATRTAQDVSPKLKGSHPYDIQMFCMDYVDQTSNFTREFIDQIKTYSYEKAVPMSQIKDVMAVELRDAILTAIARLKPDEASASRRYEPT